jgi:diacylglycerol kinase (ATP)
MRQFLQSRLNSFRYAFAGIHYVLRTQQNAWIHAAISVAVIALGIWLSISELSWALIIVSMGMVWVAECLNTAVETIINLVSPQQHPLAKIGKDVAAASVMLAAVSAVAVGLLVFGPPLIQRILFFN